MIYLQLIYEFFKIGLFSIGGGMATLPYLMDLTTRYDWYTSSELTNMVAISQSTPGPIGINMATYAGYQAAGIPGALTATMSLVLPALIIIILIAKFVKNFSGHPTVQAVFYGIRPTIAAIIGYAVIELCKISLFRETVSGYLPDYTGLTICLIAFVLLQVKQLKKVHPLVYMAGGAVLGIALKL